MLESNARKALHLVGVGACRALILRSKSLFVRCRSGIAALLLVAAFYNLDFFPFGFSCQVGSFLHCPPQGTLQKEVFRDYLSQTIPKLASGALAQAPQPATPPPPSPVSKSPCAEATDLGYSILLKGRLYKVKGQGASGTDQVHVFFDEKGNPVTDSSLLQLLAGAAWTRENIVASSSIRSEIATKKIALPGMIGTSQTLQGYQAVQDVLARAMAEAVEAAVTGGASLTTFVPNLTGGVMRSQLTNAPKMLLTLAAQTGLRRSLDTYSQLETILPPADSVALDANNLEQLRLLYTKAQGLDLPNEALASALMPKSANVLTKQALQSAVGQLLPGLPASNAAVTLNDLWKFQTSLAQAGGTLPALQKYEENLNLVIHLLEANDRKIAAWATQAARACGSGGASTAAKSMAFAFANAEGTALLSAPTAAGANTPLPKPSEFDAAICSDNLVIGISFDRHQEPGPNDNGRDWAQNFDQHGGDRFRVTTGRAPQDGSCLLTQRAFLSGKQLLPFKKDPRAVACETQTISQLAAGEKRGVHFCRRFGTLDPGGQFLVAEFDRQGNDLLAGVVLKSGGQMFVDRLPAKYDQGNGWRVDDQGHLFDYSSQNAALLDMQVVEVFKPLFAIKDGAIGVVELGIAWAGEEGVSLMLLSSSQGKLEEVAKGYRYMAPI
jgi:hypothetical protein